MSKEKKSPEKSVADVIRAEIAKIPPGELAFAKPSRILPLLEEAGYVITSSISSATSKLLKQKKKEAGLLKTGRIFSVDPAVIEARRATTRTELAVHLVEACGDDFDLARSEITCLEHFAKRIKGA